MFNDNGITKSSNHTNSVGNSSSSASKNDISWSETLANILHHASIYGIAAGYCISAPLLSIINKWAVMKFPYPGALTALQYLTSALGVLICGYIKVLDYDRLDLITMWKFSPAALIFYLSLFTNSELLLHANVDTFIVFRSVVPMFVAVGETLFLMQPWPSFSTWLSLTTIFAGSLIYVLTDYQFNLTAYSWAVAYVISMSIDFMFNDNGITKSSNHTNSVGNSSSSASKNDISWSETLANILHHASIYGIAAGYCISAPLLSIINKWAVMKFPYPGALTALQYLTSALGVLICGYIKVLDYDRLDLITMWKFSPAALIFYLSLFTNSELLLHANVDTFIVFRSVVPMFVAVGETLFLMQPWPSFSTWLSLTTIFAGSLIYVLTDYQFNLTAYSWAVAYVISMSIDFVYIKHVVMTIGLNTWGLVLYNNLEALLLFPVELLIMGELKKIRHEIVDESDWHSFSVVLPVGLSCLFGLAISFFGFSCRRAISATGFTVLGIVNKLLTVIINLVIWDKHSTLIGTIGLLICMLGGVLYQQSTSKPKAASVQTESVVEDEEQKMLLEMNLEVELNENQGIVAEETT
ncbi:hypothetical protein IEQ34_001642 [Dendrobium chrysotoxum]|uniref:Sugar phosphate transporter domain-containing protein n=1 Tax=Dendrobium chrysotoxum TaxID=161865 RepID=A0AAV7H8H5_DENCH|nr:hypothetical protein IEQ34_001642 [Dendrobium chrysotoxum]